MIARDWGIAGSISSFLGNGAVPNADYRNDSAFLSASYRWRTQNFFAFGDFDSNDVGEPGPFGSNPLGLYSGIDLVSRALRTTPQPMDFTGRTESRIIFGPMSSPASFSITAST